MRLSRLTALMFKNIAMSLLSFLIIYIGKEPIRLFLETKEFNIFVILYFFSLGIYLFCMIKAIGMRLY